MTHVGSIARKELRSAFHSPVAFLFLFAFLVAVMFTFFWGEKFFARGVADVRPLFERLPLLLIFLVAALTMRSWSEEQKTGTIELLLTLPVPLHKLVLGKFVAGFAMVAIALGLTFGLPITVSMMGPLDWGPVFGGYAAALLLGGAYLAIGLSVSAATDNQIVSLVVTCVIGLLLYLPGTAEVSGSTGYSAVELLHSLGTNTRFESIARGVLDLRDLAYWLGLIAFFLVLNTALLGAKRWGRGRRTAARRAATKLSVALAALNIIALNVWLSPFHQARADLTEDGAFALSEVTRELVGSLDEPLLVRGYFSEKSHPLLTPLVPQIRDLLEEYRIAGGSNVRVEIVDPSKDEEMENEALQQYGIRSVPFQFSDRTEQSVVNAFFHILISYGDQHEVLDFDDLIEVRPGPTVGDIDVRLRNLEYDITRTIKKVAYGFQSLDVVLGSLSDPAELMFVVTPESLPESIIDAPDRIKKIGDELAGKYDKLEFVTATPELSREQAVALYKKYGVTPFTSFLGQSSYYIHLILKVGDRTEIVPLPDDLSDAGVRDAIDTSLRRAAPGFTKTIGIWTPPAPPPGQPMRPNMPPQQQPPAQSFQLLTERLRQTYEVRPVNLDGGRVPDEIDVLIVAGPDNLGESAQRALDQFVMRGGAAVILAGKYRLDRDSRELAVETVNTGLDQLLATWGFEITGKMVLDEDSASFPIPVTRDIGGGLKVRDVQLLPYPFFVRVPRSGMAEGHIVTSALNVGVFHYASPVSYEPPGTPKDGESDDSAVVHDVLMRSSKASWLQQNLSVRPDFQVSRDTGFARPDDIPEDERGPHGLAIAATGTFHSHFATSAAEAQSGGDTPDGDKPASHKPDADKPERLLEKSPPDARVVVIGSSGFVSDVASRLAQPEEMENNVQLVLNVVDWSVQDVDLLSIRARGSHMRTLEVDDGGRSRWEAINYALVGLGLALVVSLSWVRRRSIVPLIPPRGSEEEQQ